MSLSGVARASETDAIRTNRNAGMLDLRIYPDMVASIDVAFGYEYRQSSLDTFVNEHYPKAALRSRNTAGAAREESTRYLGVVKVYSTKSEYSHDVHFGSKATGRRRRTLVRLTPRVTCGMRARTPVRGERAARRQVQAHLRFHGSM